MCKSNECIITCIFVEKKHKIINTYMYMLVPDKRTHFWAFKKMK